MYEINCSDSDGKYYGKSRETRRIKCDHNVLTFIYSAYKMKAWG